MKPQEVRSCLAQWVLTFRRVKMKLCKRRRVNKCNGGKWERRGWSDHSYIVVYQGPPVVLHSPIEIAYPDPIAVYGPSRQSTPPPFQSVLRLSTEYPQNLLSFQGSIQYLQSRWRRLEKLIPRILCRWPIKNVLGCPLPS